MTKLMTAMVIDYHNHHMPGTAKVGWGRLTKAITHMQAGTMPPVRALRQHIIYGSRHLQFMPLAE